MPRGARRGEARKTRPDINRAAVERAETVLASAQARKKLRSLSSSRKSSRKAVTQGGGLPALPYDIDSPLPGRDRYPHVTAGINYARRVVAGKLLAGEAVQLACARFLRMLDDDKRFLFRKDKAERVCRFIESMPHAKGRWSSRCITLEAFQCWVVCGVFGFYWSHEPERRVVKSSYVEVARKNAKSTFAAAIGLYMLTEDGEEGAEVYSAATTHKQATAIFDTARLMAMKSPGFQDRHGVTVGQHLISIWGTLNKFEALHSEGSTLDGLNIYCGLIDELHAHKTRIVYDVLETAVGSRVNPLIFIITTAGSNRAGICFEVRGYVLRALRGLVDDPTWFGAIYTLDPEDFKTWDDERLWVKANPNLGVSVQLDELRRLAKKAKASPASLNNFLTKHLNVWVNAGTAWLPAGLWDAARRDFTEEDFRGAPCIIAADLASRVDIASTVRLFWRDEPSSSAPEVTERHYYALFSHYLAEETVIAGDADEDRQVGNAQYSGWVRDGWIKATPGSVTDQDIIEEDLLSSAEKHVVREAAFDPYQAAAMMTRMQKEGFTVVEVRPTVLNFSSPMKEVEALLRSGRLHHNGDPVAEWMFSNVVCYMDAKDNIYPRKENNAAKIDGAVALIMAFNRALAEKEEERSVYTDRGIRVV